MLVSQFFSGWLPLCLQNFRAGMPWLCHQIFLTGFSLIQSWKKEQNHRVFVENKHALVVEEPEWLIPRLRCMKNISL